jgi:hypothetical protein
MPLHLKLIYAELLDPFPESDFIAFMWLVRAWDDNGEAGAAKSELLAKYRIHNALTP